MSTSFWQKDSLFTLILFELCLLWYLAQSQILMTSLYYYHWPLAVSFLTKEETFNFTSGLMTLRTRFTVKSSKSRRCLMSSAIPLMTCLTIIKSRIENSKHLYKCVYNLKACLDYFCEDPPKWLWKFEFFTAQTEPFYWLGSQRS